MRILLVCNAGMSTGIMKMKLEKEAVKRNMEALVSAVPMVELESSMGDADAILLGPQIRFAFDDIKTSADGIPVMTISPQDFGMMNASKVLDDLLKEMNNKND